MKQQHQSTTKKHTVKVQAKFRRLNNGRPNTHDYEIIPALAFSGKWLQEAGFELGTTTEVVIVREGEIIVKRKDY